MPTKSTRVPAYRLHKASGQASVIINGRHIYLGAFGSTESRDKYARLLVEMSAGPDEPAEAAGHSSNSHQMSVIALILAYWKFAETHYVKNGKPSKELACVREAPIMLLTVYAVAMALLESAVVVYMRHLYYANNPLEVFPLQFLNSYDTVLELSREGATVIMILTVALLADRSSRTRTFAAFAFVFGVWDLFYYFWLKVLLGWPRSWLEWDVLFLIPSVWLGPWICPAMISLLFIAWGFWTLRSPNDISFTPQSLTVFVTGAGLGMASFLQPTVAVLIEGGIAELSQYTPGSFWWWLFFSSYLLMTCGLGMTLRTPNFRVSAVPRVQAEP